MVETARYFFVAPTEFDAKGVTKLFTKKAAADLLRKGADALALVSDWNLEAQEQAYRDVIDREGIKSGEIIHPTRLALTGRTNGPGLFEIVDILGKEESVARLRNVADMIDSGKFAESAEPND